MRENEVILNETRDILLEIANNPVNEKFKKLAISDYYRSKTLQKDNNNKIKKFKRYKKGSVVLVNFGIGVGNEFSNTHFAIVMNNKDNPLNGTLTVIPLTSKNKRDNIDLGKEIIEKIMDSILKLKEREEKEYNILTEYYSKFNKNTFANLSTITTVSKFKIIKPLNQFDPIENLQVSSEILNKVEFELIKKFTRIPIDKNI